MNRKYSAEDYEEKVQLLRKHFDKPAFTTDVIVGFPGETEEEFEDTMDFVQRICFSNIHVFKYSKREGTKAAKMIDQVPEDIKQQRSNALMAAARQMSQDYKTMFLGRLEEILIEETALIDGKQYQIGHNERYLKLAVLSDDNLTNQIIKGRLEKELTDDILLCDIQP